MTPAEFHSCYGILPEAMLLVSRESRILAATGPACALLQAQPTDLIGSKVDDLVSDSQDKIATLIKRFSRSGQLIPGVLNFHIGARSIVCQVEGARLQSEDGAAILMRLQLQEAVLTRFRALDERISLLNREVMERKVAEFAIHEQRELLRTTLASIGDAVIATNVHGRITFLNGVAEDLTGWTYEHALGEPLDRVFQIRNEHTRAVIENPVTQVIRKGLVVGLANHTVLIARDGTERVIADSGAPIRDESGRLHGVVLVFRDVTERQRYETALRETNRWLKRSNENLQQFAYAAAHDLREPLRIVSLYSQLLAKTYRGKLDRDGEQFLEYTIKGATRMEELLDGLFAFTTAGEFSGVEPERVDCGEVVSKALFNLEAAISQSGAEVTWGELPVVMVHSAPLVMLFQNLIGNAIKYHRPGEVPRVQISASRAIKEWLFKVEDNGIGIEPQYHNRIFGVFKRLDPAAYPGTGIGLALCERVVESYGGRIWVESELGKGARFFFTIPDAQARGS